MTIEGLTIEGLTIEECKEPSALVTALTVIGIIIIVVMTEEIIRS